MSLLSVGRNEAIAQELTQTAAGRSEDEQKRLADARKSILDALTPWIPGDFLLIYGTLLTAWATMRSSFPWLLVVAVGSAIAFVFLGALSEQKTGTGLPYRRLAVKATVGAVLSLYAAVAIPTSGWHDFKHFTKNEASWVLTAGVLVGVIALVLKVMQKRGLAGN